MAKNTNIYVLVDTASINHTDPDKYVEISDNRGDKPNKAKHFTATIDKKKKVYWHALVKDSLSYPEHSVKISKIEMKTVNGGTQLLRKKSYTHKADEVIRGKVKKKYMDGEQNYNIILIVNNDIENPYIIDPKLRMKATR